MENPFRQHHSSHGVVEMVFPLYIGYEIWKTDLIIINRIYTYIYIYMYIQQYIYIYIYIRANPMVCHRQARAAS